MSYPVQVTDFVTGIDILVTEGSTPFFGTGAGASTMTGGAAEAWAMASDGTRYECASCQVVGPKDIRASFGSRAVPPGLYDVEVYATPLGFATKRVLKQRVRVEPSAGE